MTFSDLLAAVTSHAQTMAASSLTDSCAIQRPTRASDGEGGWTVTYGTVATVDCSVSIQGAGGSANESVIGEAVRADAPYVVRVPVGTDIESDDRLVIGDRTLEVVEPLERTHQAVLRLSCREVE